MFSPFPRLVSPPGNIFSNHVPILRTLIVDIQEAYLFSHMWYSNTDMIFEIYFYPRQYHYQIHSTESPRPCNQRATKTSTTSVRFLHVSSFFSFLGGHQY